jgi:hypothetical protein
VLGPGRRRLRHGGRRARDAPRVAEVRPGGLGRGQLALPHGDIVGLGDRADLGHRRAGRTVGGRAARGDDRPGRRPAA